MKTKRKSLFRKFVFTSTEVAPVALVGVPTKTCRNKAEIQADLDAYWKGEAARKNSPT